MNPVGAIQDLLRHFENQIKSNELVVNLITDKTHPPPDVITIDRDRFKEVIFLILSNMFKYKAARSELNIVLGFRNEGPASEHSILEISV